MNIKAPSPGYTLGSNPADLVSSKGLSANTFP